MEKKYYKALNFDLNTNKLKSYYPKKDYRQAYYDLGKNLKKLGFIHRQYSGYISAKKLTSTDIYDVVEKVNQQCPWLAKCVDKFDVTDIGKQYDLTNFIKYGEEIIKDKQSRTAHKETKESVLDKLKKSQDVISNSANAYERKEPLIKLDEKSR